MPSSREVPTLVVLAAGLGSRFGGLKQLAPVGPSGATLLEYSIFDARRAGFGRTVFVIRPDMADSFQEFAAGRLPPRLPWSIALQQPDELPAGHRRPTARAAPWGTAHAVLAARHLVRGPFAVVNADDFYGRDGFDAVARFLSVGRDDWALIGYRLSDTLSDSGGVNRGLLEYSPEGALTGIEEVFDITRDESGVIVGLGAMGPRFLREDSLVSMNLWGFTPAIFPSLDAGFAEFLSRADLVRDEYPLPTAVQDILGKDGHRVRVLAARSQWYGMTHAADLAHVRHALAQLADLGAYPHDLWA